MFSIMKEKKRRTKYNKFILKLKLVQDNMMKNYFPTILLLLSKWTIIIKIKKKKGNENPIRQDQLENVVDRQV